jgi:sensor histidine kinase YesM
MEYDNDRPVKPVYKTEIFYWILIFLFYPLITYFTFFYKHLVFLPILLLISLLLFPCYLFYAKAIIPLFAFTKLYVWFGLISVAFYILVIAFIKLIYSFFHLDEQVLQSYFNFSAATIVRESLWIFTNLLFATSIAFLKKNFEEEDIITSLEKDNANFKLKYLRSQLNPHFLFNTLNSIYSLSLQKSDQAPEVVIKLADLMRYMIYDCDEEKISLNKEIEFIRNYIDIEKIRYKADVRFTVEGETDGIMIEPFFFISFI